MKPPRAHPSPVGDVLSHILKRVDPEQQLRAYELWNFWNHEVGDGIARRAQPLRFRDGVLVVSVATHSWMQELQFMKETIRDRLNARLGANLVQDIFFVSGGTEIEQPVSDAATAAPAPAEPPLLALPPLATPELADAFRRVLQARAKRLAAVRPAKTSRRRGKKPR